MTWPPSRCIFSNMLKPSCIRAAPDNCVSTIFGLIGFPTSATFNKKKAESPVNVERMTEALASIAGHRLRPVYELIDGPGEEASEESAEISEDDLVDLVKDSFDASEVVPDGERERGTG